MVTMKDVARAAGVSTYTVSATLAEATNVSPELRARVNDAVERLGYERNSMARALKRGSSSLIGLIVSDITNPFFTELVECIQNEARQAGYSVLLGVSDHDVERETQLLRLMRSHQAGGTILCPAGDVTDYGELRSIAGQMKLVAVDNAAAGMGIDTLAIDNAHAAKLAVEHLLALGHRQIGMVAGLSRQFVGQQRLAGYQKALAGYGLAFEPNLIGQGSFRLEDGYHACKQLLAQREAPTAIFVANNLMLIGVMRALHEAGMKVPGHVSVCSIDDFPWATAFQPALTVVKQPIAEMAAAAFRTLMNRLKGGKEEPAHAVYQVELIVRESCAKHL